MDRSLPWSSRMLITPVSFYDLTFRQPEGVNDIAKYISFDSAIAPDPEHLEVVQYKEAWCKDKQEIVDMGKGVRTKIDIPANSMVCEVIFIII